MSDSVRTLTMGLSVALCSVLIEGAAVAQEAAGDRPLETVVVTAQKREESLQNVPIAISVFGEEQLRDAGITTLEQAAKLTPGVNFTSYSPTRPAIFVRGVGTGQVHPGVDGAVGVFVDEVYVSRLSAISAGLTDIARLEVLRGPQGTLFGRNTTGGAISITTAQPTDEFEGYGELRAGSFNEAGVSAMVSGPVSDRMQARLALNYSSSDGYMLNRTSGAAGNGDETADIFGKLRFDVADDFVLTGSVQYNDANLPGEYNKSSLDSRHPSGLPYQSLQIQPGQPGYVPATPGPDPFEEFYTRDSFTDRTLSRAILKAEWDSSFGLLTSISSFARTNLTEFRDADSTALDIWYQGVDEASDTFSQEFRITSVSASPMTFNGAVDWLAGVYYYNDQVERTDRIELGPQSQLASGLFGAGLLSSPRVFSDYAVDFDIRSAAAYGQVGWDIPGPLKVLLGGRYTEDTKAANVSARQNYPGFLPLGPGGAPVSIGIVAPGTPVPFDLQGIERTWRSFDPKFTLLFEASDDVNLYASVGSGFKSGGFQTISTTPEAASIVFDPEEVIAYEAGAKMQLFDDQVQLNTLVFFNDYSNYQGQQLIAVSSGGGPATPTVVTNNAAAARIQGAEAEFRWAINDWADAEIQYAYLDSEYEDYVNRIGTVVVSDFSGNPVVRAPAHQLNAAMTVFNSIGDFKLSARGEYSYTDTVFFEPDGGANAGGFQEGYGLLNLRLTAAHETGGWSVAVFARNLADETFKTASINLGDGGATVVSFGAPRQIGVTLRREF